MEPNVWSFSSSPFNLFKELLINSFVYCMLLMCCTDKAIPFFSQLFCQNNFELVLKWEIMGKAHIPPCGELRHGSSACPKVMIMVKLKLKAQQHQRLPLSLQMTWSGLFSWSLCIDSWSTTLLYTNWINLIFNTTQSSLLTVNFWLHYYVF